MNVKKNSTLKIFLVVITFFQLENSLSKQVFHFEKSEIFYSEKKDQSLVHSAYFEDERDEFLIVKNYIESYKYEEINQFEIKKGYAIYSLQHNQTVINFLELPENYKPEFELYKEKENYRILVYLNNNVLNYYEYTTKNKSIKVLGKSNIEGNKFTIDGGFIFIDKKGSMKISIYNENNYIIKSLYEEAKDLRIVDVLKSDNKVYIFGVNNLSVSNSYIWRLAFDFENKEISNISFFKKEFKKSSRLDMSLIISHSLKPFFRVIEMRSITYPKITHIFNADLKNIWKHRGSYIVESVPSVISICDHLLILKGKKKKKVTDTFHISIIDYKGNQHGFFEDVVKNDILSDFSVVPITFNSAKVFFNFSRFEKVRRPKGWYNWQGYMSKKLKINCSILQK